MLWCGVRVSQIGGSRRLRPRQCAGSLNRVIHLRLPDVLFGLPPHLPLGAPLHRVCQELARMLVLLGLCLFDLGVAPLRDLVF